MPDVDMCSTVNVEYARCLTEHTGSASATAFTQFAIGRFSAIILEIIVAVSVDSMQAFTPLPSPSASTATIDPSSHCTFSTWSPHII